MKKRRKLIIYILALTFALSNITSCSIGETQKTENAFGTVIPLTEYNTVESSTINESEFETINKDDALILIHGKQYDCNSDTIIINGTAPGDGILSEEEYELLQEMPNLKTLKVDIGNEKDYHNISCISTLTTLSIPYSVVTTEGLEELSKMPYLETLIIKIDNNSNLECLSKFSSLKSLKIYYDGAEALTVDYKKTISELQQLEELYLNCFQIDNLDFLEHLKNLKMLDLSENRIKDISVLEDLSDLRELNLSYNNIEDFSALSKLQNLNTLLISGNNISSERFDKIKETLPSCEIIY